MEVFISWSGQRGRYLAECVARILTRSNHVLKPWVSSRMSAGTEWQVELNEKLKTTSAGLVLVTPESRQSEWIHYEAGALKFSDPGRPVIPLCFELGLDEISRSPLAQLQTRIFEEARLLEIVLQLNGMLPNDLRRTQSDIEANFAAIWKEEFLDKLPQLSSIRLNYDNSFRDLLESLSNGGCGEVKFANSYNFESGFEDWHLYESLFSHAKKRLWVLGRKNRKAFDKSFRWFFEGLKDRPEFLAELRFMFLSPDAPMEVLNTAHKDDDFTDQLARALEAAEHRFSSSNLHVEDHCRMYAAVRNYHIIVCDDSVLFAPVNLDKDGMAESLTRSSFQVVDVSTTVGQNFLATCEAIWRAGKPFRRADGSGIGLS